MRFLVAEIRRFEVSVNMRILVIKKTSTWRYSNVFVPCFFSPGYHHWNRFTDSMKEILAPHLKSKYRSASNYNWGRLKLPVFGGPKGSSFKEWTGNYTSYLIHHVANENRFSRLIRPFLSGLKYDLRLGLFLLPHVVLVTLMTGNISSVNTEFRYILNQVFIYCFFSSLLYYDFKVKVILNGGSGNQSLKTELRIMKQFQELLTLDFFDFF